MLRVAGETRIVYLADLRMSLQELGDFEGGLDLPLHPQGEGREAIHQNRPGGLGGQHAAEILPVHEEGFLVAPAADDRAPHVGAESTDVLRQRLDRHVHSPFQRTLAIGRGERVVDQHVHPLVGGTGRIDLIPQGAHSPQVNHLHRRVRRRLGIDHAGLRPDRRPDVLHLREVAECRGDLQPGQPSRQQGIGATIDRPVRDDVVPRLPRYGS